MKTIKRKQLVGEIVELKDSFRIYGHDGIYFITTCKEEAFKIAHSLLKAL